MEYLINEFFLIYVTSCHNHSLNSIIDKAAKLMAHIFLKQKSYHIKKKSTPSCFKVYWKRDAAGREVKIS